MSQMQGHPHLVKETSLQLKSHIKSYTLIVRDLSTPLLTMDRTPKQKLNREIKKLTCYESNAPNRYIYSTFHRNMKE